jgi:hypothetical protein
VKLNLKLVIDIREIERKGELDGGTLRADAYAFGMGDLHLERSIPLHLTEEGAYKEYVVLDMVRDIVVHSLKVHPEKKD